MFYNILAEKLLWNIHHKGYREEQGCFFSCLFCLGHQESVNKKWKGSVRIKKGDLLFSFGKEEQKVDLFLCVWYAFGVWEWLHKFSRIILGIDIRVSVLCLIFRLVGHGLHIHFAWAGDSNKTRDDFLLHFCLARQFGL